MSRGVICKAPWNEDQVKSLNEFQGASFFHPFTCGERDPDNSHHVLEATSSGWRCPKCPKYYQDWCLDFMANWEWRRSLTPKLISAQLYLQAMADRVWNEQFIGEEDDRDLPGSEGSSGLPER